MVLGRMAARHAARRHRARGGPHAAGHRRASTTSGRATRASRRAVDLFGFNYKGREYGPFHRAPPGHPRRTARRRPPPSARAASTSSPSATTSCRAGPTSRSAPTTSSRRRGPSRPTTSSGGSTRARTRSGEFVWTGFDYLGEPTPYGSDATEPARTSRTPRARAGWRRSWRPWAASACPPAARTSGSWTWPASRRTASTSTRRAGVPSCPWPTSSRTGPGRSGWARSRPCTSIPSRDEAELFLNGVSLGRRKRGPLEYRFRWDDVRYQPGELRVVTRKGGQAWADAVRSTAGPRGPDCALAADRTTLARRRPGPRVRRR